PYGNACMGLGLLESVYSGGPQNTGCDRIGDAMLHAARSLQSKEKGKQSTMRVMVDTLASMISPAGTDLQQERLEHAALYQLLGDPTLRLHPPQPLDLSIESTDDVAARSLSVAVTSPIAGTLIVAIERPLTAITQTPTDSPNDHDAHGTTITEHQIEVPAGKRVLQTLSLPLGETGPLIIRGFVHGKTGWASAAQRTFLTD
ncbi:MAG: peptidase C25, partial [Rhodopirellula bahusiensis]